VAAGTYSEKITHYTVLRTIESAYGLAAIGGAASVSPVTDVWN
jgi:acid phosphatase